MAVAPPPPVSTEPFRRLTLDIVEERRLDGRLPPGPTSFSLSRTRRFASDPLPMLLELYERYGPVFSIKILHASGVFLLGPEANHHVLVANARNFSWREGSFRDLIPFLGDGLLTIDGDYHRISRKAMLPAFHRERLERMTATMSEEAEHALAGWRPGSVVDVYAWSRRLALRIALKALFGIDPDRSAPAGDLAHEFERGLGFYARDYFLQMLRGPRTPFDQMRHARRRLSRVIFDEIARRRARGHRGEDVLALLLEARDEDGRGFSDGEIRDHLITMLFAGHDTTTSTVTFLLYELARNPSAVPPLQAEQDERTTGPPTAAELMGGLPRLEMALDETLRLYPPAWIGPRRAREPFELAGHRVPGGAMVYYCSWASHHLPDVWPEPERFDPERFTPERKAALPKGAYVPFGGGSRTCIGMRFGQLEVKAIASAILRRFRLEVEPGYELSIRQMPTLSPREGMPMVVHARG